MGLEKNLLFTAFGQSFTSNT